MSKNRVKTSNVLTLDPSAPLRNPKYELFAVSMSQYGNATRAAQVAGYKGTAIAVRGHETLKRPGVRARIDYLCRTSSDVVIRTTTLSKSWVLQELKSNVVLAKEAEDYSSVNRAIELIGKELGMFVERKILGIQDLRSATAEQLYDLLAEVDSQLQIGSGDPQVIRSASAIDPPVPQTIDSDTSPPATPSSIDSTTYKPPAE